MLVLRVHDQVTLVGSVYSHKNHPALTLGVVTANSEESADRAK